MTRVIELHTGSRLHFGLLGWGPELKRQFGGAGLMIERPGLRLRAEPASDWHASGRHSPRCLEIARNVAGHLEQAGLRVPRLSLEILDSSPDHVGLGLGTQLSLAVARVLAHFAGLTAPATGELASMTGRGQRSGVGLYGFDQGGLIVDGGRARADQLPPLLARFEFPSAWEILLVTPDQGTGCHGAEERKAFSSLPPVPPAVANHLSHLLLMEILPGLVERNLPAFGSGLTQFQELVGRCFVPVQGGVFASDRLAEIASRLGQIGLHGVGQSSWGPALYGFTEESPSRFEGRLSALAKEFELPPQALLWTRARNTGATLCPVKD